MSIEQSGSDNLLTPFMRAPRRTKLPAKQRNSPGSGPAGPENFGYFPSLESSPPAGGISPKKRNRGFAAAAASFFLSDQKETKESPGVGILRKDLRHTPWSFRNPTPRTPVFTGGARGVRGQSRPARKSLEQCQKIITAVLLNELDRLLLQDAMRLSGTAYTVDGGAGRFSCVGADVSLARGRPQAARYGKRIFSSTVSSGGYIQ